MSKAVQETGNVQQSAKVPTVDAFRARCEARAWLVAEGELTLPDAVDELQASAMASGIVDAIGQDQVQEIMADAFAKRQGAL
jgi:hypothetical protein